MAKVQLEIAKGFYRSNSLPLTAQRCINWMPIIPQTAALNTRALFDVSGILPFADTGKGANRGSIEVAGVPFFVGSALVSVSNLGVVTDHGAIGGSQRVSMATNGRLLVIVVPGGKSFVFDTADSTLVEITDPNFRASNSGVFVDGFFVFSSRDGSVFFNSALNDPLTYDALDFGTAEANPDIIVALHVNHNELFVCGSQTIEIFRNIGGVGFPFQRIAGALIQKGVHAQHSVVDFDNTFVFIGGDKNEQSAMWRVTGSSSARRFSTSAIDNAIQEFTRDEISRAFAVTYAENGNFQVAFTFQSTRIPSKTFVYNATTSAQSGEDTWHERQSGDEEGSWRAGSVVAAHGKLLVGDTLSGQVGALDKNTFTEFGDLMVRQRTSSPFSTRGIPAFVSSLMLTMEAGTGLTSGPGSNPQIRMSFSDDGGKTFSSEFSRSYGKRGRFGIIPSWRRLGRVPANRVLCFRTSEPVKSVVIRLEADITQRA